MLDPWDSNLSQNLSLSLKIKKKKKKGIRQNRALQQYCRCVPSSTKVRYMIWEKNAGCSLAWGVPTDSGFSKSYTTMAGHSYSCCVSTLQLQGQKDQGPELETDSKNNHRQTERSQAARTSSLPGKPQLRGAMVEAQGPRQPFQQQFSGCVRPGAASWHIKIIPEIGNCKQINTEEIS